MAENEAGVTLIIIGGVLMVVGAILPFIFPICGLGVLLLIIGIILVAVSPPHPASYPPAYGYAAPPAYPYPPQPPAAGMTVPASQAQYSQPTCYVCGSPLSWVPQYGRWYCSRCQSYR